MKAPGAWLALWNDVDPAFDDEYNDWHGNEHVPERLGVPGIEAATRYRDAWADVPRYFTWYALASLDVLRGATYQALLRNPTPWSRRMRGCMRHVVRYACETRIATSPRPGPSIVVTFPAGPHAAPGRFILGEPDAGLPDLPWLARGIAAMRQPAWVRLDDVRAGQEGSYRQLQEF